MTATAQAGVATTAPADTDTRRTYLLDVVRKLGEPVTTKQALKIYAVSPWRTAGRNTARRDLGDLARRAYLVPVESERGRAYILGADPRPPHPFCGRSMRTELLDAIRDEGGQWTAGRARAFCRQTIGTHVWRATARRHLADLHRLGHLERHGDGTPRRFYSYLPKDGA
jgi:hypothetical protein